MKGTSKTSKRLESNTYLHYFYPSDVKIVISFFFQKFKPLESQQKPLLGAVFGSSETNKNTEPVKFGTSSGFAFGSTGSTDQTVSTNNTKPTSSGLTFGSSSTAAGSAEEEKGEKSVKTTLISEPSSGFGISSENSESIPAAKSGNEKPTSSGFSFGGGATDNKPSQSSMFKFSTNPSYVKNTRQIPHLSDG